MTNNPMQLWNAPRCNAKTRAGTPCQAPAIKGKTRCRMHGGKGSGAPYGNNNAYKHGFYSGQTKQEIGQARDLMRGLLGSLKNLDLA